MGLMSSPQPRKFNYQPRGSVSGERRIHSAETGAETRPPGERCIRFKRIMHYDPRASRRAAWVYLALAALAAAVYWLTGGLNPKVRAPDLTIQDVHQTK